MDGLMRECSAILKEVVLRQRKQTDFITSNIILITRLFFLANCDLVDADQEEINRFEKDLKRRFGFLTEINLAYALSSQTETRSLREIAAIARQTLNLLCLEKREEYANNFIVFLTIKADELSRQRSEF